MCLCLHVVLMYKHRHDDSASPYGAPGLECTLCTACWVQYKIMTGSKYLCHERRRGCRVFCPLDSPSMNETTQEGGGRLAAHNMIAINAITNSIMQFIAAHNG